MLGGKHAICSLGLPTLADRHSGVQWGANWATVPGIKAREASQD